jgi:hypothetical protein
MGLFDAILIFFFVLSRFLSRYTQDEWWQKLSVWLSLIRYLQGMGLRTMVPVLLTSLKFVKDVIFLAGRSSFWK